MESVYTQWIVQMGRLLSRLVREYNARRHRTIAMRSVDVTPATSARLLSTVYKSVKIAALAQFRVEDTVRVSKYKTLFAKGYTPNWTTEVFRIAKVQRTNPVTYLLEDSRGNPISGGFYEHELLRARNPDFYLVTSRRLHGSSLPQENIKVRNREK
ncbi:hypothetical protein DMN91_004022 [Ooceraea biroi]|uniref:Uncharacterized protein n=1 Tax=Ooceraea biroi TaxID=2015173 RepID=A0A3L8DTU5_OOCBI|nr:hypothetical protein DMN91_004022 [Ooceraea biroi]